MAWPVIRVDGIVHAFKGADTALARATAAVVAELVKSLPLGENFEEIRAATAETVAQFLIEAGMVACGFAVADCHLRIVAYGGEATDSAAWRANHRTALNVLGWSRYV